MDKREVLNRMISEGLIPVIRVTSAQEAMDVADAIKEGGVSFIEITMSVQGAIDVIKELTQKYKDEIIMGAGTVLDPETGRAALLAGAQFIVSPTLNLDLIHLAHRYSAVVIPGAMTPYRDPHGLECRCGYGEGLSQQLNWEDRNISKQSGDLFPKFFLSLRAG